MESQAKLGADEAMGMMGIERENQLKNALLSREERMGRETRNWQEKMQDQAYRRQLNMMRMQRDWQSQDALMSGLGSIFGAGMSLIPGLGGGDDMYQSGLMEILGLGGEY